MPELRPGGRREGERVKVKVKGGNPTVLCCLRAAREVDGAARGKAGLVPKPKRGFSGEDNEDSEPSHSKLSRNSTVRLVIDRKHHVSDPCRRVWLALRCVALRCVALRCVRLG